MVLGPLGPVRLTYERLPREALQVDGPGLPAVRVVLDRDGRMFGRSLFVDGRRASVGRPRRRMLPPAADRRTVTVGDRRYELAPSGLRRSLLTRNGLGVAEADGGLAAFVPGRRLPGGGAAIAWCGAADPLDVALAYAMVLAFGAGSARSVVMAVLELTGLLS